MILKHESKTIKNVECKTEVMDFRNIKDFKDYINSNEFNKSFGPSDRASILGNEKFTGTSSFEEAMDLFVNGWTAEASSIEKSLIKDFKASEKSYKQKPIYSVEGFQCSVPRYLNGIPTSMVNKKNVVVKQKIITLNKNVSYPCGVDKETIYKECLETLKLVRELEKNGQRVNLNIIIGSYILTRKKAYVVKIRIKGANERLNISKMAFPLVHPSMLRRMFFRLLEVHPDVPRAFVAQGYGKAMNDKILEETLNTKETLLPLFSDKENK